MSDEPKHVSAIRLWAWLTVFLLLYVVSDNSANLLAWRVYHASGSKFLLHTIPNLYAPLHWVENLFVR